MWPPRRAGPNRLTGIHDPSRPNGVKRRAGSNWATTCRSLTGRAQSRAPHGAFAWMNRAQSLLELQKIDRALDALGARLRAIAAELAGNTELTEAVEAVVQAEAAAAELDRHLRSVNLDRTGVKEHISSEESKLYGGGVKAPKELQSLELEVASLRRRLAVLDDESLALMLERDSAMERLDAAQGRRSDIEHASGDRSRQLASDRSDFEAKRDTLASRRDLAAKTIDGPSLAGYDKIRRAKHGIAVAELRADGCGACGIQLPRSAVEKTRQSDSLIRCPGCGRILAG